MASDRGEGIDRGLWSEMAALGGLGLAIPEAHGGLGQGIGELGVLYEELGRALSRVPVMGVLLAAQAVAAAGRPDQQARWLPALAAGRLIATVALPSEPRAPGPVIDEDARANGTVADVVFAGAMDLLFIPVRRLDGGRALLAVSQSEPGVVVERRSAIDLTRDLGDVVLRDVAAAGDHLIELSEQQWTDLLDHAGLALAADSIGGAARILERTVAYMQTRVQFDRPIGSFQALKHRAASWKVLLEAAGALVRHAAERLASGDAGRSAAASAAKFYACDAFAAIAGDSVQLHGGIGFTWEHECHLFLKRAKLNQVLFGAATAHKERVAGLLFATPAPDDEPLRAAAPHPAPA
jgi:alkylation response protein AidB-like acyl-CoA dehydrogenase